MTDRPRSPRLKRAVRRQEILAALLALLAEGGFASASTTAIAARVGLTQSGLFKHFGSKEEMLRAAMESMGVALDERVGRAASASARPLARARAVLDAYLEAMAALPALPALLFAGEVQAGGHASFLREDMRDRLAGVQSALELAIADGVRAGELPAATDVIGAAMLLMGAAQAVLLRRQLADDTVDAQSELDRVFPLIASSLEGARPAA